MHNLLGQVVATLYEGTASAGQQYVVTFDASKLPSGVYFYTLRSESVVNTKKMMLIK